MVGAYLIAVAMTLAIEVPLYVLALTRLRLAGPGRAALCAVGLNLVTHPVLWWSLALARPSGWLPLVVAEVAVCAVEAALLWLVVRRDAALVVAVSVLANAASLLAGLVSA
ncbi:hypothetical protein R8Z50_19470 [Longispora sp. K20-0274]|uniref:hypothetical protein n=1 Tax=Longispora sp. K20-0274 TaxID=3088255 RepID=UPI00399B6028